MTRQEESCYVEAFEKKNKRKGNSHENCEKMTKAQWDV